MFFHSLVGDRGKIEEPSKESGRQSVYNPIATLCVSEQRDTQLEPHFCLG